MIDLVDVLTTHRILVCVGSGGVGKTTTAAALALSGALRGKRTAVVTIDPAKRLADCLGVSQSGLEETALSSETFGRYGLAPTGSLTALLVDQKSAWDAAVERYAPTSEIKERIFANRFYQGLSRTFAGSHEYMALDRLATLSQSDAYDLIVLDTPPVQQALDFFEAPMRLQKFLDSRMSKWLMRPTVERSWAAFSFANQTTTFLLHKVEEATGISALGEIAEFFTTMQGMFEDFGSRFNRVSTLLSSKETAFVLITSPDAEVLQETEKFRLGLERMTIPLRGVVVNRMHQQRPYDMEKRLDRKSLTRRIRKKFSAPDTELDLQWMVENFLTHQERTKSEEKRIQKFCENLLPTIPIVQVPLLRESLVDLGGLTSLLHYLFPRENNGII